MSSVCAVKFLNYSDIAPPSLASSSTDVHNKTHSLHTNTKNTSIDDLFIVWVVQLFIIDNIRL